MSTSFENNLSRQEHSCNFLWLDWIIFRTILIFCTKMTKFSSLEPSVLEYTVHIFLRDTHKRHSLILSWACAVAVFRTWTRFRYYFLFSARAASEQPNFISHNLRRSRVWFDNALRARVNAIKAIIRATSILRLLVMTILCTKTRAFWRRLSFLNWKTIQKISLAPFGARDIWSNIRLLAAALKTCVHEHVRWRFSPITDASTVLTK